MIMSMIDKQCTKADLDKCEQFKVCKLLATHVKFAEKVGNGTLSSDGWVSADGTVTKQPHFEAKDLPADDVTCLVLAVVFGRLDLSCLNPESIRPHILDLKPWHRHILGMHELELHVDSPVGNGIIQRTTSVSESEFGTSEADETECMDSVVLQDLNEHHVAFMARALEKRVPGKPLALKFVKCAEPQGACQNPLRVDEIFAALPQSEIRRCLTKLTIEPIPLTAEEELATLTALQGDLRVRFAPSETSALAASSGLRLLM